jgi:2-phospho-L-lactate guanylyltransferase (CobY/MobA/RfbA family)
MRDMEPSQLRFGAPDSYLQHRAVFREANLTFRSMRLFGLGLDIDTAEDYETLPRHLRVQTEREN